MRLPAPRFLLIVAIVLLVIVVIPCAVIEKARRDAEHTLSLEGQHLELDSIEFDKEAWLLFHFNGVRDTDDPGSFTDSATWSLYPWGLSEEIGVMTGDFIMISDRFLPDSEMETEDEELIDSDVIENDEPCK